MRVGAFDPARVLARHVPVHGGGGLALPLPVALHARLGRPHALHALQGGGGYQPVLRVPRAAVAHVAVVRAIDLDHAAHAGQDDFDLLLAVVAAAHAQRGAVGLVVRVAGVRAVAVVMAVALALAQRGGQLALGPHHADAAVDVVGVRGLAQHAVAADGAGVVGHAQIDGRRGLHGRRGGLHRAARALRGLGECGRRQPQRGGQQQGGVFHGTIKSIAARA